MNDESEVDKGQVMKDVIGFLSARYRDDEEGAMALLGVKEDVTKEESVVAIERTILTLIGMTDFALSVLRVLNKLLGADMEKLIEQFGLQLAVMVDGVPQ